MVNGILMLKVLAAESLDGDHPYKLFLKGAGSSTRSLTIKQTYTPGRFTSNLKENTIKSKIIFQTSIFVFHTSSTAQGGGGSFKIGNL